MEQLSRDQTVVARELEQGLLTYEEARNDPRGNILLQCIGATTHLHPIFESGTVSENSVYMLCSDGFRHMIESEEMQYFLQPGNFSTEKELQKRLTDLVELNKKRGEQDNITVAAIKTSDSSGRI